MLEQCINQHIDEAQKPHQTSNNWDIPQKHIKQAIIEIFHIMYNILTYLMSNFKNSGNSYLLISYYLYIIVYLHVLALCFDINYIYYIFNFQTYIIYIYIYTSEN